MSENPVQKALKRFDGYQKAHPWIAFPLALAKKFGDDRAGYLAVLVAYYAFFSLFPLLLVLVSLLGFVLGQNSGFRQKVLDSVLSQIPVIGSQIGKGVTSIHGSGIALIIGLVTTLVAGMGVIQALQYGMDQIWNVPVDERPKALMARLKSLLMLAVLGVGAIGSTVLAGIGGSKGLLSVILQFVGVAGSVVLNLGLFLVAFKVLTTARVSWRDVLPGAAFGAVAWGILQGLGGYIVKHQLTKASDVYGFFAIVIGLLSWLYIGAQLTYLAAEINVVKVRRLWPRSLDLSGSRTPAEKDVLSGLAGQEERHSQEQVKVAFKAPGASSPAKD